MQEHDFDSRQSGITTEHLKDPHDSLTLARITPDCDVFLQYEAVSGMHGSDVCFGMVSIGLQMSETWASQSC